MARRRKRRSQWRIGDLVTGGNGVGVVVGYHHVKGAKRTKYEVAWGRTSQGTGGYVVRVGGSYLRHPTNENLRITIPERHPRDGSIVTIKSSVNWGRRARVIHNDGYQVSVRLLDDSDSRYMRRTPPKKGEMVILSPLVLAE